MRSLILPLSLCLALCIASPADGQDDAWTGRKLSEYLDTLNDKGLRIIYSTDLVNDDLVLVREPDPDNVRQALESILSDFSLAVEPGPAGSLLIVGATAPPAGDVETAVVAEVQEPIPEIVVTSSLHRLDRATPNTHTYLDRELATRMPLTADEAVRLTHRLPGTASGGISSKSHIRGGEADEVLFLFDGLRLYEPYHLKDFQSIATIINSNAIGSMDFYSGAYPARFGDRMSGVLNVEMRQPEKPVETEIALSFFNASLLSMGTFGGDRQGDWLLSARRGNLDLIVDVVDPDFGSPDYQDYLAHVGWEFGPQAMVSANFLVSDDKLSLFDDARGEQADATYSNQVFWLRWQADWSAALSSDTSFAISDITDRRSGQLDLPGIVSGTLSDYGEFRAQELRSDWRWLISDSWMLRFGVNMKDLDAAYQFTSQKTVEAPFDSILGNQPATNYDFVVMPTGAQYAAYTELRWRPIEQLTMDFGLRWDQQTYTTANDDKQYSPRVSMLYRPGTRTEIRLGWGQFHQAQEINELQISDGVTSFFPAQRAEHVVLNVRHQLTPGIEVALSFYRKGFETLRPRFENAFNTLTLLPELQFDRVLVDSSRAEARGAEVLLSRVGAESDLMWWLGYAWSWVEDDTPAGDIRRSWDQTHTMKAGISWRWSHWDLSFAAESHTGWPTTLLNGELVPQPGGPDELLLSVSGRNAFRHAQFHTLDARVSRTFDVRRGDLTAYLELTNLFDRENPCCTEYSLNTDGTLGSRERDWLPILPSLGFLWRF